jgi:sec-independent protein translocase protein TatA
MGFGPVEAIVILAVVLMIFGAGRLTGVGKAMGQGLREFRQETREVAVDDEATLRSEDNPTP